MHDVGAELGSADGLKDKDGVMLGEAVGKDDGARLGCFDGWLLGPVLGATDG